ncbi:lysylphosphatidylglycerol synthase transmembrane domain-containing protein, partial [Streptomyces odonnellii]|uniref:lysylphosphatidylglycerol synthase transmembrane domain-containing protein n=1 Tax=Streptomyces odonnellii TaxID=1417980 RepID=UPI000A8D5CDB
GGPRAVRPVWWVVAVVLVAAAVVVAITRRHELVTALDLISHVHPTRLVLAAAFEAASLICVSALQRWLLRAGGARLGLGPVSAVVLAANAIAGALPGGAAFAVAWVFRRFRRWGVGQVLAGTVLAVSGLLSALSLLVLLLAGVLASGTSGPVAGALPLVVGVLVFVAVVAGATAVLARFPRVRRRVWRVWRRIGLRSRRLFEIEESLTQLGRQVRSTRPGIRPWGWPFLLALLNWGFDLACLIACTWSLGIAVPWPGILVAYGLTQFAGSLRLTPGGLGVVETSLTALLVLYGMRADEAIAVTLLYRVVSFWALQPVGWAIGLVLTLKRNGGRHEPEPSRQPERPDREKPPDERRQD